MSHWSVRKKDFLPVEKAFNNFFSNDKIILVDGGAAGRLSDPFIVSPNSFQSIRFEPRGKDVVDSEINEIYIDGGIWIKDSVEKLHIANVPTTSSICPPDFLYINKFNNSDIEVRKTIKIVDVNVRSIDSCVFASEMPKPNFIKLDVHSAELPGLIGAQNSLDECIGLLIETWHSPVHYNQGLHYQIEQFAIEKGFEVYDICCAANWKHKFQNNIDPFDRGQYIGSEILFFKKNVSKSNLVKKAYLLSLFGYANDAKNHLLELENMNGIDELIISINKFQKNRKRSFIYNFKYYLNHIQTTIGRIRLFFKKLINK